VLLNNGFGQKTVAILNGPFEIGEVAKTMEYLERMIKRFLYKFVGVIAVFAFVAVLCIYRSWEVRMTAITGIISSVYFVQKHRLEELHLFKDLFKEFNERYDNINEELNRIVASDGELSKEDKDTLFNYFNLCAEEYLYYKEGYVLLSVWKAWENGMKIFFSDQRVGRLWDEERATNSYYGFKPD